MEGDTPSIPSIGWMRTHDVIQDEVPDVNVSDNENVYDDVLVQCYGYPPQGRAELFAGTPLYNKFKGGWPYARNVKLGQCAVADRVYIREVARFNAQTFVYIFGGRRANTVGFAAHIKGAHHVGDDYTTDDCVRRGLKFPLPSHVRAVYIGTQKPQWCSVDSVAFQSFAWPRNTREARRIAR